MSKYTPIPDCATVRNMRRHLRDVLAYQKTDMKTPFKPSPMPEPWCGDEDKCPHCLNVMGYNSLLAMLENNNEQP